MNVDSPFLCFQKGNIVEVSGESGSGKTQIALQLCVDFQRLFPTERILWISSEGPFPSSRLKEIGTETELLALDFNINRPTMTDEEEAHEPLLLRGASFDYCSRVRVLSTIQASKGSEGKIFSSEATEEYGLVVVDSIAGMFRGTYETGEAIERSRVLSEIAGHLRQWTDRGALVLVLNQVTDVLDEGRGEAGVDYLGIKKVVPALGTSWAHVPNSRLLLSKKLSPPGIRLLKVLSSCVCATSLKIELVVDKCGIHPPDYPF